MERAEKIRVSGSLRSALLLLTSIVLFVGSVFVWLYVNKSVEEQRRKEFIAVVETVIDRVQDSVSIVVERLFDLRAFLSHMEINEDVWRKYLISNGVERRYPGVYSFAFAPIVKRGNLNNFLDRVRVEEKGTVNENYSVFPESLNAELFPIRYLFTSDPDIGSLMGYDVGTSETQVAAITKAVIDDVPIMTDLLKLDLVIPGNKKTGYEVILPVYNKIDIENYPKKDRKKYFMGLVGTWMFPLGMLSHVDSEQLLVPNGVSLTVFDGENSLFTIGETGGGLAETREIYVLNKKFRFEFSGKRQRVLSPFNDRLPVVTAIGLVIMNLMWAATVGAILLSRRAAERLAAEATKDLWKFKQAVEGVSDLVVITDPEGKIQYINEASEKITGFRRESVLGKSTSLWGKQMDEEFYKRFWKTIKEDKKPFWGEVTNKRKNGELYAAEINVSPILDEKRNLVFFVGIERDLSRIKAVDQMKTEFISLASHQLRTPLSAVKWFGKMLTSGDAGKLNPTQTDYVEKIIESNDREIKLVNSLLNVSRIESGKIVTEPKITDLSVLIAGVVTDFKIDAEKLGRKISVTVEKKIPSIAIDEDLVRHVYANLISNALRYTDRGGRVALRIYISRSYVVSEIKDNGIGIPKREQKRVFDKFFRASNALKKETDGNGLGLYLSKTIVESSGGKMGFRSSEGKGSTFWFTLPLKPKIDKG